MRQRFYKIIVALLLVLPGVGSYSQEQTKSSIIQRRISVAGFVQSPAATPGPKQSTRTVESPLYNPIIKAQPVKVPANLYIQQLGFVCKKELQVQKATRLPLFFRLGSLPYCNYLEAKH